MVKISDLAVAKIREWQTRGEPRDIRVKLVPG
jgi:hypothetical protein